MEGDRAVDEQLVDALPGQARAADDHRLPVRHLARALRQPHLLDRPGHRVHEPDALAPGIHPHRSSALGAVHRRPHDHGAAAAALPEQEADADEHEDDGGAEEARAADRGTQEEVHGRPAQVQPRQDATHDGQRRQPVRGHGRVPAAARADAGHDGPLLLPAGERLLPARTVPVGQQPGGPGHAVLVEREDPVHQHAGGHRQLLLPRAVLQRAADSGGRADDLAAEQDDAAADRRADGAAADG